MIPPSRLPKLEIPHSAKRLLYHISLTKVTLLGRVSYCYPRRPRTVKRGEIDHRGDFDQT